MTIANYKYQDYRDRVLDLIYKKFKTQKHWYTTPLKYTGLIAIYPQDLTKHGLDRDDLFEFALDLEPDFPGITFVSTESDEGMDFSVSITNQGAPDTIIKLPKNFEKQYEKLIKKMDKKDSSEKIQIFYSNQKGLYRSVGGLEKNYGIDGKRAKMIEVLIDNKQSALKAKIFGEDAQKVSAAVRKINELVKEKLNIESELIINLGKGYHFDPTKYEVIKDNS